MKKYNHDELLQENIKENKIIRIVLDEDRFCKEHFQSAVFYKGES